MTETLQFRAIVSGRVQGVHFRVATQTRARELELSGWARNCSDRTVEVLAAGPKNRLEDLIDFLRRGPDLAMVTDLAVEWTDEVSTPHPFEIRR